MKLTRTTDSDPLYVIFEQHLVNFHDNEVDRTIFINQVIQDYFAYLRNLKIIIPVSLEKSIAEELTSQVQVMLLKKIYGCHSIQEFQKKASKPTRVRARRRYTRLLKAK
jgi:hypothetical protein